MNLLSRITGVGELTESTPRGNLDDALEAEARMKAIANSQPRNAMPSPFDTAPHVQPSRQFSLSLTPTTRGVTINTSHPLESTVEEVGGRVTLSIKW